MPLHRPVTTTPRIFTADPDVCVPCQCHSAQARSSWIVEATKVARKSGTWANKAVQFSRTWASPVKGLSGCSGCSPLKSLAKQLTNASMSCALMASDIRCSTVGISCWAGAIVFPVVLGIFQSRIVEAFTIIGSSMPKSC